MSGRACDACKRRKIKCDSSQECPNCRLAGLVCTYNVLPKKRGPKPSTSSQRRAIGEHASPSRSQPEAPALSDVSVSLDSPSSRQSHENQFQHLAVGTWQNSSIPDARHALEIIHRQLLSVLYTAVPSLHPRRIIDDCISLHLQFIFPIAPLYHEPTLRRDAATFFSDDGFLISDMHPETHLVSIRSFTQLVSLCAYTALAMPSTLLPLPDIVSNSFLQASRACLQLFEDYDLEHPASISVSIRASLAAAVHNKGHAAYSWYLLSQALLISYELVRHPRHNHHDYDPLESQLRLSAFRSMHMANRSAAVLNNRPVLLSNSQLTGIPFDTAFLVPNRIPLLDTSGHPRASPFEERVLTGTDLCYRLWSAGWDLLEGIQDYAHLSSGQAEASQRLMRDYFSFAASLDCLPPWLLNPDAAKSDLEPEPGQVPETVAYRRGTFWRLRVDVVVTFHCLRMVLLRQCIAVGLVGIMGLNEDPIVLEMSTVDVARDCLDAVDMVPFEFLQVNGEPLMEKFRQIGSALLELNQNTNNDMIRTRSKTYLTQLLNLLARLDSKAVDELIGGGIAKIDLA